MLKNLDKTKYPIPENFPIEEVRALFKNPEVLPDLSSLDLCTKCLRVNACGVAVVS